MPVQGALVACHQAGRGVAAGWSHPGDSGGRLSMQAWTSCCRKGSLMQAPSSSWYVGENGGRSVELSWVRALPFPDMNVLREPTLAVHEAPKKVQESLQKHWLGGFRVCRAVQRSQQGQTRRLPGCSSGRLQQVHRPGHTRRVH